ncbi:MAG TPA: gas vesicle protein GvpJ [Blastocatellia bacterium]|nr:gas vesicle protein GvpJ [Blastocatellia bacterium]
MAGEITISVADIDLIFVGLNLLLGSVEAIDEVLDKRKKVTSGE